MTALLEWLCMARPVGILTAACALVIVGAGATVAASADPLPTCQESSSFSYSDTLATGVVQVKTHTCGKSRDVGTLHFSGTMSACNALGCRTARSKATCSYRHRVCTFTTSLAHPPVDVASYEFDYSYQGDGRDVVTSDGTVVADCADAVAVRSCP